MNTQLAWYVGFIVVAALTGIATTAIGIEGILRLVVIICAGIGGGVLGESLYKAQK